MRYGLMVFQSSMRIQAIPKLNQISDALRAYGVSILDEDSGDSEAHRPCGLPAVAGRFNPR